MPDQTPEAAAPNGSAVNRWREGKKPINVWVDADLVDRVHDARRAQRRSLRVFVEMSLESSVELVERYSTLTPPRGRGPRKRG